MECGSLPAIVVLDDSVKRLGVFVAYTIAWGEPPSKGLPEEIYSSTLDAVRAKWRMEALASDPVVRAYRDFYWRIGVDPTKTRPSGEALVRRILRGKPFPRINPLVDAGNLASAETLVPIGLYDLDRARPPLVLRRSIGGEEFRPIGGKPERLREGIPILVDSHGIVLHVYPHRDSIDTSIGEGTRRMLVLGAGVPGVPEALVRKAVRRVLELLSRLDWRGCEVMVAR